MSRLQKALFLSDKGYADLKKAIFACTLTNLAMLLPFCVTVMIFSEILTPFVNGGSIQWNHIWMLWGAGIVSAILVFLAAKNDYRKTYIASYKESNTTRLRIAEHSEHESGDRLYDRLQLLLRQKQCPPVSHDRRL